MTKESILDPYLKYAWECDEASPVIPYSAAEKAMDEWAGYLISNSQSVSATYQVPKHILDEYAKQQAIAFGDWIKENRWCYQEHLHEPSNWRYYNQHTEEDKYASTDDLYSQFIEQQTK